MTTFLIPLLLIALAAIIIAARARRTQPAALDEADVEETLYLTIRDKGGPWRASVWWMDWDAVEWWEFGVLWDDYDPLP